MKYELRDITAPKTGMIVIKDCFWVCEEGDPKRALFYGTSPQCNLNKKLTEWILGKGVYPTDKFKNLSTVFVETAFVPERP